MRKFATCQSIMEMFESILVSTPHPVLTYRQERWRPIDIYRHVNSYSKYLQERYNILPRDKVVLLGSNSPSWLIAFLSIHSRGAIVVPMSWPVFQTLYTNRAEFAQWKLILATGGDRGTHRAYPEIVQYECHDAVHHHYSPNTRFHDGQRHDPMLQLYTSGTSSLLPKPITFTNHRLLSNLDSIDRAVMPFTYDSSVNFLPWYHCYGLNCELWYMLGKGYRIHVNDHLPHLLHDFRTHQPEIIFTVPKLLYKLYATIRPFPSYTYPLVRNFVLGKRIRAITVGGAGISVDILRFFQDELGIPVYQGYGMTEASPMISLNTPSHNKIGSVGKVLDCNQVHIAPDQEIHVKGSNVVSAIGEEWIRTGDEGYVDHEGYLFITGRSQDRFKMSNGKFVDPESMETQLLKSPWIQQVCIVGKDQETLTAIVYSDDVSSSPDFLLKEIHRILQKEPLPTKVVLVKDPLPITAKGTLRRKAILESYVCCDGEPTSVYTK